MYNVKISQPKRKGAHKFLFSTKANTQHKAVTKQREVFFYSVAREACENNLFVSEYNEFYKKSIWSNKMIASTINLLHRSAFVISAQ